MQAPKKKTSKSKRNMRRGHHALREVSTVRCGNCGEPRLLHRVCPSCGMYRNRQVVEIPAE